MLYSQRSTTAKGRLTSLPKAPNIERSSGFSGTGSFDIYHMDCLLFDKEEKPCDTNTKYQSVTIQGTISILENIEIKKTVLKKIVAKYSSQLSDKELPGNMVKGTAVLELEISAITGKYYE